MNPLFPSRFKTFPSAIFKPFVMHSHWFCLFFFPPQIRVLHSSESTPFLIPTVLVILLKNKMKFVLWQQEPFAMKTADCCSSASPLSISSLPGTNHFIIPGSGAALDEPNFVHSPESRSSNIDSVLFFFLEKVSWAVHKLSHSHLVWEQPALQMMTHMSSRLAGLKALVVLLMFFF